MNKRSQRLTVLLLSACMVSLLSTSAWAVRIRSGDEVTISSNETVNDDLYVSANTLVVDGTVLGDLVGAAHKVTIRGRLMDNVYLAGGEMDIGGYIRNDLNAVGRTITLDCNVGDDVRLAGQSLTLDNNTDIDDDFLAACQSLVTTADSLVNGSLLLKSAGAILAGRVKEDVRAETPALKILGAVGGDVDVTLTEDGSPPLILRLFKGESRKVERGLNITDQAAIVGDVEYRSFRKANIDPNSVEGTVRRTPLQRDPTEPLLKAFLGFTAFLILLAKRMLTIGITGVLLLFIVPNWTTRLLTFSSEKPGKTLILGLLSVVAVFIAAILIAGVAFLLSAVFGVCSLGGLLPATVGLGGLAEASLFFVFWIFVRYVAPVLACMWVGEWVLKLLSKTSVENRYLIFFAGVIPIVLVTSIICIGDILGVIISVMALGGLWKWVDHLRATRAI